MTRPRTTTTRRAWTPAEDAVLRQRYPNERTATLCAVLARSYPAVSARAGILGVSKTAAFMASPEARRLRRGNNPGAPFRFQPGHVPANKGTRRPGFAPGRMSQTQFKPGNRTGAAARNWCPVGTIRSDPEGYLRIKVREATHGEPHGFGNMTVWPMLQRWTWSQAHGPIPPGHHVRFKNGDRTDCALENLELVTRAEMMRRNSLHNLPAPLPQTIQLLGALTRKLRRSPRAQKQDR